MSHKNNFINEKSTRRSTRSKIKSSSVETEISTSLLMLKLNRTPGRWQYKTSPKPRVSIRKVLSESSTFTEIPGNNFTSENSSTYSENGDLNAFSSQNSPLYNHVTQESKQASLAETLNVEISTPNDLKGIYYEIATIKTPYIFQVGSLKKTRFLTITSTIEKTIEGEPTVALNNKPLYENILTSSLDIDQDSFESSITFLRPIHLDKQLETPSLETVVKTISTTLTKLKTQVLPLIHDKLNYTSYTTLLQTYDITTVIVATKTIFPVDDDHFEVSRNFKDFSVILDEAGSELNLELDFGDSDNSEVLGSDKNLTVSNKILSKNGNRINALKHSNINDDQKHKLAYSTVIFTSSTYIVPETLWESHVIAVTNGPSTVYSTFSKSIGTLEKTQYEIESSSVLIPNLPATQIPMNPYLLPHEFKTITTSVVQQTTIQQINSKVLKLTFGAKTAYTTIYSTLDVPTSSTMFITTAVPIQPTAAFPGYFAPPFHPFQFVG